jgi:hypothetical protein
MPITRQRALDYITMEWGSYIERFNRLPKEVQEQRVKTMGYEAFRDMLAHILAWWEEGVPIILAIAEARPFERKKYDFDVFNAEAVAKYKTWEEGEFLAHFEKTRQKMETDLKSVSDAAFEDRRVRGWANGIFIHHAREHLVTVSRFIVMDLLKNEWATYIEDFNALDDAKKKEFLSKYGFESLHDVLAHIIGWWEESARIIAGILDSPSFTWETRDADTYNAELVKNYSKWTDQDILTHYESVRIVLLELTAELPEDAFFNKDIAGWLMDDVVGHYDEHPIG